MINGPPVSNCNAVIDAAVGQVERQMGRAKPRMNDTFRPSLKLTAQQRLEQEMTSKPTQHVNVPDDCAVEQEMGSLSEVMDELKERVRDEELELNNADIAAADREADALIGSTGCMWDLNWDDPGLSTTISAKSTFSATTSTFELDFTAPSLPLSAVGKRTVIPTAEARASAKYLRGLQLQRDRRKRQKDLVIHHRNTPMSLLNEAKVGVQMPASEKSYQFSDTSLLS